MIVVLLLLVLAIQLAAGPIAHPAKGEPYHRVNSLRGIRRAKRRGYKRIDLDLSVTADGVIVVNHWPRLLLRDGFLDPLRKIARRTSIVRLTWAKVRRLRTRDGYKVRRLERMLRLCAQLEMTAVLEPKSYPEFQKAATWAQIHRMQERTGAHVQVRVLAKNNPHGTVLRYARVWFKAWEI